MSQQYAIETTVNEVNGYDVDVIKHAVNTVVEEPSLGRSHFRVVNTWNGGARNSSFVDGYYALGEERVRPAGFMLHNDEPPLLAGSDSAPNPAEQLLHALAGCITVGITAHAAVRGVQIDSLSCEVEGDIDVRGFLGTDESAARGFMAIRVRFQIDADRKDMDLIRELVAYSPIMNTLTNRTPVDVEFVAS